MTTLHRHIIYTKYSTLPSGISVYIVLKVGIFPEAGGRGKYYLQRVQYMPIFHKEGFWIFSLLHRIFSTRNYCILSDVPIDHAQYQGWNIGVEHRNIFHPYEPIWLVRFTRLCKLGERSEPHTGVFNRDFSWYIYVCRYVLSRMSN